MKNITIARYFPAGLLLLLWVFCARAVSAADPPVFRIVASLTQYDQPAGLIEGSPDVFYSTAGSSTHVAFSITSQGLQTVLASFPSGNNIGSWLLSGPNNLFYSTMAIGGNPASVFSVTAAAGGQKLYPVSKFTPELTQNLPNGTFLAVGVDETNDWDLLTANVNGAVTLIYEFPAGTRLPPSAIYANDGNYYGIAQQNPAGTGYVYRVTPTGAFTNLYNFPPNTFTSYSIFPLLQANDGNLYGAVAAGGANSLGIIYRLTLAGEYTLLYTFPKGEFGGPTWLIEGSDGNLYGSSVGVSPAGGTSQIFRITKSGEYKALYTFRNPNDGACQCDLVQGSDGIIYGTAQAGGRSGAGVVFALDVGMPKPQPWAIAFGPQSGPPGTRVRIWGQNMLAASVQFNGVPATGVFNSGANYVWATVPNGATTGPITVTTTGGANATHTNFVVE